MWETAPFLIKRSLYEGEVISHPNIKRPFNKSTHCKQTFFPYFLVWSLTIVKGVNCLLEGFRQFQIRLCPPSIRQIVYTQTSSDMCTFFRIILLQPMLPMLVFLKALNWISDKGVFLPLLFHRFVMFCIYVFDNNTKGVQCLLISGKESYKWYPLFYKGNVYEVYVFPLYS